MAPNAVATLVHIAVVLTGAMLAAMEVVLVEVVVSEVVEVVDFEEVVVAAAREIVGRFLAR